jgi:hypothetical protein
MFTARAVLIELPRARLAALERSDDEVRIGLVLRPLRLGDDAAPSAPGVERAPLEVLEAGRRAAGFSAAALAAASSCSIMAARRALRDLPPTQGRSRMGAQNGAQHRPERIVQPRTVRNVRAFGDLVDPHDEDMYEVGKPPRRSRAAVMASLTTELGNAKLPALNRERLIAFGRKRAKQGAGPPSSKTLVSSGP